MFKKCIFASTNVINIVMSRHNPSMRGNWQTGHADCSDTMVSADYQFVTPPPPSHASSYGVNLPVVSVLRFCRHIGTFRYALCCMWAYQTPNVHLL